MTQRPPALIIALAVLAASCVLLPLLSILWGVPWEDALGLFTAPESQQALMLSLGTAGIAAVVCLILGLPLALVLTRTRWRGRAVLRAAVLVPLVLPPVVSGLALLMTFGRRGLLGGLLDTLDIRIVFTTMAVVLAQIFVSLPFTVLTLESSLRTLGTAQEVAAAQLGARPLRVLVTITLPRLIPALVTGVVLAFARSLGEFGATLTFAGSMPGLTRTLPLEIYRVREVNPDAAATLSLLLVIVAFAVVLLAYAGPTHIRRPRSGAMPMQGVAGAVTADAAGGAPARDSLGRADGGGVDGEAR
ncbi:ABC transporter permease [Brachybacterium timonense]|uniref:ABC transporter permease n=1 Tax=Brachybacterium timonense TaxID=2050896 RepID=UPI001482F97F|nr:ABC transporter permease [Brachybacterium timonense]